jgi:hypothetical protein
VVTIPIGNDDKVGVSLAVQDKDGKYYPSEMLRFTLDEGTQDHYFINLHSQPTSGKIVTLSSVITGLSQADFEVSPTLLTFDETNWNIYQRVNITADKNKILIR